MDADPANPNKIVYKKIKNILNLVENDIFTSKSTTGKIADPSLKSSHIKEVRDLWFKLNEEERSMLTNHILNMKNNKNLPKKVVSYDEIAYYFVNFIIPYNQEELESSKKSLIKTFIWANDVNDVLSNVKDIDKKLSVTKGKKNKILLSKLEKDYNGAVQKFYGLYGKPRKSEEAILSFRLFLSGNNKILNYLLQERKVWYKIKEDCNIAI